MDLDQSLPDHIRQLEQQSLQPEARRSRHSLDGLLANEFTEFASDGVAYSKEGRVVRRIRLGLSHTCARATNHRVVDRDGCYGPAPGRRTNRAGRAAFSLAICDVRFTLERVPRTWFAGWRRAVLATPSGKWHRFPRRSR